MIAQRFQKAPQQSTKAAYQARASGTGGRAQRAAHRARHGSPRTQHPREQQDGVLSVSGPQVVQVDAVHLGLGGGHGGAAREKPRPQRATELAGQPAPAPSPALVIRLCTSVSRTQQGRVSAAPVPGPPTGALAGLLTSTGPQPRSWRQGPLGGRRGGQGAGTEPGAPPRGPGRSGGATRTLSCTGSDPKGDASLGVHRLTFWSLASLFSRQPPWSRMPVCSDVARLVCKMRRCLCTDC